MYLFVGEQRSSRAKELNVYLQDGALAAAPLFDALRACGIDPLACRFTNWFERGGKTAVKQARKEGMTIVGMGRKVQRALESRRIPHVPIIHPAARGKIRKRENYIAHIEEALSHD